MQSLRADRVGGLTTFLTMAYIVVVNPAILSTEGTGLPFAGVMTATILLASSMSILMGLYAKLPFGVAPGMGLNAFLAFGVILGRQVPWPIAMGLVFWAGVIFLMLNILPFAWRLPPRFRIICDRLRICSIPCRRFPAFRRPRDWSMPRVSRKTCGVV